MRVLLMISNSNMSARVVYTRVLRERFPGWGLSNMSGLPLSPPTIIKGFEALVYELFAPDDPRRYTALKALLNELTDLPHVRVITHIEGPYRDSIVADLEQRGVVCVGAPFGTETVAEALARIAPASRQDARTDGESTRGWGLRGIFRRR